MIRWAIFIIIAAILLAVGTSAEVPFALVFGWIPFLARVLPQVSVDPPSVIVGSLAVALFVVGVHWLGCTWRGNVVEGQPKATPWKVRWSLAIVTAVFLLFGAGISMIDLTHQITWLATSPRPLMGEGIKHQSWESTEENLRSIGNAIHMSFQDYKSLSTRKHSDPLANSWETRLLPYMSYYLPGFDPLLPWNHAKNEKYFKCVLPKFINPDYRTPELFDADGFGLSHYSANSRIFAAKQSVKMSELLSGNTILIGEVNANFSPWGRPANWRDPEKGINRSPDGFGGPNGTGARFLMSDNSVRFIRNGVEPHILRRMSSPPVAENLPIE